MSRYLGLLLVLPLLSGCAARWTSHYVYAPYDQARVADAQVMIVRPVVTTRPSSDGTTPWGKQADRLHEAATTSLDGPFDAATPIPLDDLGWTEETWDEVDDVVDALLSHAANPLPHDVLRVEEGTPDVADVGLDGFVLLVAVQPSMKETIARMYGAAGEVNQTTGFSTLAGIVGSLVDNMNDAAMASPPPGSQDVVPGGADAEPDKPGKGRKARKDKPISKRARLVGNQNRVDVAFLLVDRRSGRFVAAECARMEPVAGPLGSYRGAVARALRDWRLAEPPWTTELFQ